jgi:hypothetical protein
VLRPSVLSLQPERGSEFATSYAQQYANQRRPNGTMRLITRMITSRLLDRLVLAMNDKVDAQGMDWAQGFFFGHELRGIKSISKHQGFEDPTSPADAIDALLEQYFLMHEIDDIRHQFYIDVGIEYFLPEHCLLWKRQSHGPLMTHLMPVLDPDDVARMVTLGAKGYYQDVTALLRDVCGFRLAPSIQDAVSTGIFYIQCYATEKNVADSGILNHNTLSLPLAEGFRGTKTAMNLIESMFSRMSAAHRGKVESCARIEIRMPLDDAADVLVSLPNQLLAQCLIPIRASTWWYASSPL